MGRRLESGIYNKKDAGYTCMKLSKNQVFLKDFVKKKSLWIHHSETTDQH